MLFFSLNIYSSLYTNRQTCRENHLKSLWSEQNYEPTCMQSVMWLDSAGEIFNSFLIHLIVWVNWFLTYNIHTEIWSMRYIMYPMLLHRHNVLLWNPPHHHHRNMHFKTGDNELMIQILHKWTNNHCILMKIKRQHSTTFHYSSGDHFQHKIYKSIYLLKTFS